MCKIISVHNDLLNRMAHFFCEPKTAYDLMSSSYCEGIVFDGRGHGIPVEDFFEKHQQMFFKRQKTGTSHNVIILEEDMEDFGLADEDDGDRLLFNEEVCARSAKRGDLTRIESLQDSNNPGAYYNAGGKY